MLGLPTYGETAGAASRPLGSILTDADALAGYNFTSEASQRLYERRRAAGWGVDPVRCTKYLTSSQALTLNLLGPLEASPAWATRVLGRLLDREDLLDVPQIWVEFAPQRRSQYLNDMTRMDALVELTTKQGAELLVIETKYADRFNSRHVEVDLPPYRDLADRLDLWVDPATVLASGHLNQLVRCHALAAAMSDDLVGRPSVPGLLVLTHREDLAARLLVDDYTIRLANPAGARVDTLDAFVEALTLTATTPVEREIARALQLRYIAEAESEEAWLDSGDRSLRAKQTDGRPDSTQ